MNDFLKDLYELGLRVAALEELAIALDKTFTVKGGISKAEWNNLINRVNARNHSPTEHPE